LKKSSGPAHGLLYSQVWHTYVGAVYQPSSGIDLVIDVTDESQILAIWQIEELIKTFEVDLNYLTLATLCDLTIEP
jgi:hypothetical protein